MLLASPSALWLLSTKLHRTGRKRAARLIKAYNYFVFRAVLPPEAQLEGPVALGHLGLGVVVHPNISIGHNVRIWHGVTLSVSDAIGSSSRLVIADNVVFGAGSVVVSREGLGLSICADVSVGANAVVTRDIVRPGSYGGVPAQRL